MIKKENRVSAPEKFVSLHAHSGFSTFDGLDYPQEHIDFIIENGMNGWCLTEHGHMNSFGHAFLHAEKINKRGGNFKFVPGCEMYVHPDLEAWKLDFEIAQSAKRGDKKAASRLKDQKENIVTPLTAVVDEDDEVVGVEIENAGMTIENEDETKSGKFYDPLKRRHHLVVLPKTSEGLQRLFHLVSKGYKDGFYRFPRVDYKMLKEAAKGGHLMISTACVGGPLAFEVFKHAQQLNFDELKHTLLDNSSFYDKVMCGVGNAYQQLVDSVGINDVYLELQINKLPAQHLVNRAILEFAKNNGLSDRLVVTTDSHYSHPDHWREREIYKRLGWLNSQEFNPSMIPQSKEELKCELYPKNASQIWETYLETSDGLDFYDDEIIKAAIELPYDIVHNRIGDIQPDRSMKLPSFVVSEGLNDDKALLEECKKGLVERGLDKDKKYIDRLKYELKIIKDKNFSRYFLTMQAIIKIARRAMTVGPARGSSAGSLVAYVLRITDVDPFEYDLMFERFLNPSREGAPDIDCVHESHLIMTKRGMIRAGDIVVGDEVLGGDGQHYAISNVYKRKLRDGEAPLSILVMSESVFGHMNVVPNHKFILSDGSVVFAKDIKAGDSLLSDSETLVIKTQESDLLDDYYVDITVSDDHRFHIIPFDVLENEGGGLVMTTQYH